MGWDILFSKVSSNSQFIISKIYHFFMFPFIWMYFLKNLDIEVHEFPVDGQIIQPFIY